MQMKTKSHSREVLFIDAYCVQGAEHKLFDAVSSLVL